MGAENNSSHGEEDDPGDAGHGQAGQRASEDKRLARRWGEPRLFQGAGVDFALDPLGGAGGVIHQASDLVEEPVAGLGHRKTLRYGCPTGSRQ